MPDRYLAAAVQMSSGADRAANLARAEVLVREAAGRGASLVVLPEVFAWRGPRGEEAAVAEPIPGPTTAMLAALARSLRIHLCAGSLLERAADETRAYNTSCLFDPQGTLLARYRKVHLFDVELPGRVSVRESATRAPGADVVAVATELGTLGLSVCYDLRFPELYRRLVRAGAEVLLVPSAFTFPTGAAHWEVLCARAPSRTSATRRRGRPDRDEPARLRRLGRFADRRPVGTRRRARRRGGRRHHRRDRPRVRRAGAPGASLPRARPPRGLTERPPGSGGGGLDCAFRIF
jgi:predicted amidohydrolase